MTNKLLSSAGRVAFCSAIVLPVIAFAQAPQSQSAGAGGEYSAPAAAAPGAGGRGGGRGRGPQEAPKPAPHLADGTIDLGGNGKGVWAPKWVTDWATLKGGVEKPVDVPFTPAGKALFDERQANASKDDPEGYCLPAGVPRYTGTPYPFQIIQLKDRVVILYEGASHMYRVILLGTKHSADPDPTWLGESIGHYEGTDTLVVDTIGFNDRTWLDYAGHPASSKLHVIEKFIRPSLQQMRYEATIEDPANYTKPWTTSFLIPWQPTWEIKEYVCLENNKDLMHLGTTEPK